MLCSFLISYIGISKITNPLKLFQKWFIQLVFIGFIINYSFQVIFESFFIDNTKSAISLIYLISLILFTISTTYIIVLFTKKEQRSDIRLILNKFFKNN